MVGAVRTALQAAAPDLAAEINILCEGWLRPLIDRLDNAEFRPKLINDAIWGTVELLPWEVALLDSPLLQRMRGVRQLGFAHLVFPGAVHNRLEHIVGVVGAVEQMVGALDRHIRRRNRGDHSLPLPLIRKGDRYRLRLAALFHDLGLGTFGHAMEPVLQEASSLGALAAPTERGWRTQIQTARSVLEQNYLLDKPPSESEVIAVMIVMSEPVAQLFSNDRLITERWASAAEMQEQVAACVIGAIEGPGTDHLSAIVNGQLDADRLDYLSRDAHHAGIAAGFDREHLLSKLELLEVRKDNTPGADPATGDRLERHAPVPALQFGIAASGFASFEQMLVGRAFLYDRVYHHHKVRAAEAMAQRMLLVAERDRGSRFDLGELFLSIGDDTMLRVLAEEVAHAKLATRSDRAARLARGLLNRELLYRAYAFSARFITVPSARGEEDASAARDERWRRVLDSLQTLEQRYDAGVAIHALALQAADTLARAGVDTPEMQRYAEALIDLGPEQIIVDLPERKTNAIRILARNTDGTIKVPESSFGADKSADAYDLRTRTGHVFCPRQVVPVVALAARLIFATRFQVVMNSEAERCLKGGRTIDPIWLQALGEAGLLDAASTNPRLLMNEPPCRWDAKTLA